MGVCLEICLGYRYGDDPIFRVSQSFDMGKDFSPIYESLFVLEGEELAGVSFRHSESIDKESGYGDKYKLYTIGQVLDALTNVDAVHELSKPETVRCDSGNYQYSRWLDERVQGLIAYLRCQKRDSKAVFYWS